MKRDIVGNPAVGDDPPSPPVADTGVGLGVGPEDVRLTPARSLFNRDATDTPDGRERFGLPCGVRGHRVESLATHRGEPRLPTRLAPGRVLIGAVLV
ncbi:hypothetical protein BRD17_01520 [Halobacteriales archaeon SW_7_68_16]|nr:MAG: hypothetical protein BRD17_01520 [Halobacteriales archaeon SW_7_68_16]